VSFGEGVRRTIQWMTGVQGLYRPDAYAI